jgi:hypothetical protein
MGEYQIWWQSNPDFSPTQQKDESELLFAVELVKQLSRTNFGESLSE